MEKGKRIKSVDGEILLPEAMIQHIQSFMSRKEAARTTILSKSWYNAWLTRPLLDFDARDVRFYPETQQMFEKVFEKFVKKTMERYQNLSLKIESFRLCSNGSYSWGHDLIASSHNLIVDAMKMGATTVQLENCSFTLPQEVLGSETLLKLTLIWCEVNGKYGITCSRLKSLTLEHAVIKSNNVFKDLFRCCILMEELSLSYCFEVKLSSVNLYALHKLKCLFLDNVVVDSMFFTNFACRFPCLKDLTIHECHGYTKIQIVSSSINTISFKTNIWSDRVMAMFDVPNIRKFTYSCFGLPSNFSINGPSREWEFDISITSDRFNRTSWFINLKKLLKKFRLSKISLFINLNFTHRCRSSDCEHEADVEVVPQPLVVESLMIRAPPTFCHALVVCSFAAFRPKFITHHYWRSYASTPDKVEPIDILRKRLIRAMFVSNWQEKFRQFGLKQVNAEMYEEFDTARRPLWLKELMAESKAKVRLQLIWED